MTRFFLLLVAIAVVPLAGVALVVMRRRRGTGEGSPRRRLRFGEFLDDHTRARLRRLEERMARSQLGPCQRFGHALIDGRCRRHGCTYTTQRSER